jgi:hypothetical protein
VTTRYADSWPEPRTELGLPVEAGKLDIPVDHLIRLALDLDKAVGQTEFFATKHGLGLCQAGWVSLGPPTPPVPAHVRRAGERAGLSSGRAVSAARPG